MKFYEPKKRPVEIDAFLSMFTGKNREDTIRSGQCMCCNNPDTNFKDELSKKEYVISGMCQTCQDKTFHIEEYQKVRGKL